jgi:DNA-binding response OmpR family regulator
VLVLIVEDDLTLAETLRQAFAADNHECLTASNALDGLDLLRAHPIDLILLDINLPGGLSGYAACEAYRNLRPRLPIIIITGAFTSDADARLAEHVGASGFLRKPFAMEGLFALIDQALASARAKPPALFAFDCEECGAESRVRQEIGDGRRLRCPNCGAIRVINKMEDLRRLPEPRPQQASATFRRRILVVDNTEHFRLYLLDLLTEEGYYIVTARDGREAFRLAQEWVPDLVITEILLPGMGGIALCQQIKAHPRLSRTPVITITSLRSDDYRTLGEGAGVDLFMVKPIRAEDLFEKVRALIARSSR